MIAVQHGCDERRMALGQALLTLPDALRVVSMRTLAFRMAELAHTHRLSALGAEAVAAAERLGGSLLVWEGDDGPQIREATGALGISYLTIAR